MDSGAFTEIATHGRYRHSVDDYLGQIERWRQCGKMLAAVSQDYMCEPWILEKTGMSIAEHQNLTIERYDALRGRTTAYILPVLQGYHPDDYVRHVRAYGVRLADGQWVGVGSVCKRNASPDAILDVLLSIKRERPDLRLHGFGLKKTALEDGGVFGLLHSADSMAWSYAARREGRNCHDWREAARYVHHVRSAPRQGRLLLQPNPKASNPQGLEG